MQTIMKNVILILLIACYFSLAANPASSNYIMQQWTFTAGNDTGDKPESSNYILSGSAIGTITGEDAASSNYGVMPGYYLGPIIGEILPPENVTITIVGSDVVLNWDAVSGADSYSVYYSDDPHKEAALWELKQAGITGTSWDEPIPGEKLFYYVTAVNSSRNNDSK
ncbi:MAG: hypothetical protein H8E57_04005 [Candidatus Cloacimonetes bacterium]|nr:hypothetical protein [Candidatus Cloacimonadota bacterium]